MGTPAAPSDLTSSGNDGASLRSLLFQTPFISEKGVESGQYVTIEHY